MATKRNGKARKVDPKTLIAELFRDPELKVSEISEAYKDKRIKPLFQEAGSRGGQTRAENMSAAQRKASADLAIRTRWAKYRRDNGKPPKPGDKELLGE